MKSTVVTADDKTETVVLEHLDLLADFICAGDEFALLRETLRLYCEELEKGVDIH